MGAWRNRAGRLVVAAGLGLTGLGLAAPAARAEDRNETACFGQSTDAQTIAGCTALLKRKDPPKVRASILYNRGLSYRNTKQSDRAFSDFDEAIRLDASDAKFFRNRGLIQDERGETDRALADYSEAVRLDPGYANAWVDRGYAYYTSRQDYDRAIGDLDAAARLDPDRAFIYYARALAYEKKGDLDAALRDFEAAAQRDAGDDDYRQAVTRLRAARANSGAAAVGAKLQGATGATLADLEAQDQATAELWTRLPLTTRNAMFVSRKATVYGGYDRRPTSVFAPGEPLLSYVEPVGYAWEAQGDGVYRISLAVDFELIARGGETDGKILGGQKDVLTQEITSHARNREFYVNTTLTADDLPPGEYVLAYTLKDRVGGRSTRIEQPFTVRP